MPQTYDKMSMASIKNVSICITFDSGTRFLYFLYKTETTLIFVFPHRTEVKVISVL